MKRTEPLAGVRLVEQHTACGRRILDTGSVAIGSRYAAPKPVLGAEAEKLQAALLSKHLLPLPFDMHDLVGAVGVVLFVGSLAAGL